MASKTVRVLYFAEGDYGKNRQLPLSSGYKNLRELKKVIKAFKWENYRIVKETTIVEVIKS